MEHSLCLLLVVTIGCNSAVSFFVNSDAYQGAIPAEIAVERVELKQCGQTGNFSSSKLITILENVQKTLQQRGIAIAI